jgi:A/G-specific adenine glycosylase
MTPKKFRQTIYSYYKTHKRNFPWRPPSLNLRRDKTLNPYKVLVSEIMLQQTQTDRVEKKYTEWLKAFPTFQDLAQAPLQKVLRLWQGLGYNSRALRLKKAAEIIVAKYNGKLPADYEQILDLPGIGPYTAGALMAFAFNKPFPIVETNIRTVYIHFFFGSPTPFARLAEALAKRAKARARREQSDGGFPKNHGQPHPPQKAMASPGIHDQDILKLVEKTIDKQNPREWFYALMDYGVMLKKTIGNINIRSKHYSKQSAFIGSNRQVRAAILRAITISPKNQKQIALALRQEKIHALPATITKNIDDLMSEGFIKKNKNVFAIL